MAIFSTPNAITQSYHENPYHYKEYTPDEWYKLLSAFFQEVVIYVLWGNTTVTSYEEARKKTVLRILKGDIFNLRKLLPRPIRQFAYDIATYSTRSILNKGNKTYNIGEDDYFITDWQKTATVKSQMNAKRLHISPALERVPWNFLPSDVNLNSKTPALMLEKFIKIKTSQAIDLIAICKNPI